MCLGGWSSAAGDSARTVSRRSRYLAQGDTATATLPSSPPTIARPQRLTLHSSTLSPHLLLSSCSGRGRGGGLRGGGGCTRASFVFSRTPQSLSPNPPSHFTLNRRALIGCGCIPPRVFVFQLPLWLLIARLNCTFDLRFKSPRLFKR